MSEIQKPQPSTIAKPLELHIQLVEQPEKGKLLLDFGKSVSWFEMTPEQAMGLGKILFDKGQRMLAKSQGAK